MEGNLLSLLGYKENIICCGVINNWLDYDMVNN
jgi:hypothetical protein